MLLLTINLFTHTAHIQPPLFVFRIFRHFRLQDRHCAKFGSDNRDYPGSKTKYVQRLTSQLVLLQKYMRSVKPTTLKAVSVKATHTHTTLPKTPLLTSITPTTPK